MLKQTVGAGKRLEINSLAWATWNFNFLFLFISILLFNLFLSIVIEKEPTKKLKHYLRKIFQIKLLSFIIIRTTDLHKSSLFHSPTFLKRNAPPLLPVF